MAESIEVHELGIDAIHRRGFELNVATGIPYYTFAHYNCPIVVRDESGIREWPAGVSVLHAPEYPRYVRAESSDLLNTWFHCSGPGVAPCLAIYGIPVNTVLDLGDLPFLRSILEEVRQERIQRSLHWQDAVSDLVRRLFRELGTLIADLESPLTPAQRKLERTLRDIRAQVHSNLAHRWTVAEMASLSGLTTTWFAMVYTKQFGASPLNDLLNARLKHAEALLSYLPMTVAHIATDCGFAHVEHFTRLYHKRMGYPPGQVRKQRKR
jgi:AraC family transcriptional regulator, arabinose operon regulatory protein